MSELLLEVKNLSFSYPDAQILDNVSIRVEKGQFVGVVGSNGCGKSTLLKNVYRILHTKQGEIIYKGENIKNYTIKEMARKIAVVSQFNEHTFDSSVLDVVLTGRIPFKSPWQSFNEKDHAIALEALEQVDMVNYQDRFFSSLSGGEKQRIILARALTQQPEFIILDEPTNHLDIRFQLEILSIVKQLKIGVLSTMHDLSLIANYCNYIYALKDKSVYRQGSPAEVLTEHNIKEIFGVNCKVIKGEENELFFSYK
ncbi:ABC transporter ATP-binding protein [Myroides injenensis]|uniref:ABC transporter ATP-binding protein n=1 Tax=Myroides injenensis TaxID=1183151 RepID=UPI0002881696|nr:ABC transporter ATP-binding protein [Myroides injenensis]